MHHSIPIYSAPYNGEEDSSIMHGMTDPSSRSLTHIERIYIKIEDLFVYIDKTKCKFSSFFKQDYCSQMKHF